MAFTNASHTNVYGGTFTDIVAGDYYNISGNLAINNEPGLLLLFNATSPGAAFDSQERSPPAKCHPGTRQEILGKIAGWLNLTSNRVHERVLWLHGPAGAGKSAIAQTVAEDCAQRGMLAASFFFSRGRPGRDSIDRLYTTIAFQLAIAIPQLRPAIQQNINNDPSTVHKANFLQLHKLVVEPLQSISTLSDRAPELQLSIPSIIIIDGLDECTGSHNQSQILLDILYLVRTPGLNLRFLIVSRREYNICHAFEDTDLVKFCSKTISLYGDFRSHEDVRIYLLYEFDRIHSSTKHQPWMVDIPKPWPITPDLDLLVDWSDGYFIYASTLVRFVDQESLSPIKQLDSVLNASKTGTNAFGELDKLYYQVLSTIPDLPSLKTVLMAVYAGVPVKIIPELFALEPGQASTNLRGLQSVIEISFYGIPYPVHASFYDFLRNSTRAGKYHMDYHTTNAQITDVILGFLQRCFMLARSREPSSIFSLDQSLCNAARFCYSNWYKYLKISGPHLDMLSKEVIAVNPNCWMLLPKDQYLPWHDKTPSALKDMLISGLRMLLRIEEEIKNDLHSKGDHLVRYFARVRDMAFKRLLSPSTSLDWRILYAYTSLHFHLTEQAKTDDWVQRLLNLDDLLPQRSAQIHGVLKALFPNTALRSYLVSKAAPKNLFVNLRDAHAHIANCCMALLTADVDEVLAAKSNTEYRHARHFWAVHLSEASPGNAQLQDRLQTIDQRFVLNTRYYSDKMNHLAHLERLGIHVFPKNCCIKCAKGQGITVDEHDQTISKLSSIDDGIRDYLHAGNRAKVIDVRQALIQNDIKNVERVLSWLKRQRKPPRDVLYRWETYHLELCTGQTHSKPNVPPTKPQARPGLEIPKAFKSLGKVRLYQRNRSRRVQPEMGRKVWRPSTGTLKYFKLFRKCSPTDGLNEDYQIIPRFITWDEDSPQHSGDETDPFRQIAASHPPQFPNFGVGGGSNASLYGGIARFPLPSPGNGSQSSVGSSTSSHSSYGTLIDHPTLNLLRSTNEELDRQRRGHFLSPDGLQRIDEESLSPSTVDFPSLVSPPRLVDPALVQDPISGPDRKPSQFSLSALPAADEASTVPTETWPAEDLALRLMP